jgi:bla regulator protein blaR1
MASQPIYLLLAPIVASSMAVLLIGVLRVPLRSLLGAQAAYWLWLLIPVSALAVLLPAPPHPLAIPVLSGADAARATLSWGSIAIGIAVWALGAAAMLGFALHRQRAFIGSLGRLDSLPGGIFQSDAIVEPMLVGAWRPRVVVPADFDSRYTHEERALVLAHERAHVERGDALVNAVASLCLCLSWFNPLAYWAIGRFRLDQELACDAEVLAVTGVARRRYAVALLKTQLSADFAASVPAACHWKSAHPLKERIAVLKHPSLSQTRRMAGVAVALSVVFWSSVAVWASQPAAPSGSGGRAGETHGSAADESAIDETSVRICPVTGKPMVRARPFAVI